MQMDPQLRVWRWRIFTATWLSYFGYYFCRKPFYTAKSTLTEDLGWNPEMLGYIGAVYLIAYAAGQFMAGLAGNRWGPRVVLLTGMLITLVVNAAFGVTNSPWTFAALMGVNGLAQATGWSNNVGTMGSWFHRGERGTVMGFWATNFQVGSIVATPFAAWVLGEYGLRWSFFAGSIVMLGVWTYFLLNQRNRPEDVGLAPVVDPVPPRLPGDLEPEPVDEAHERRAFYVNVLLIGTFYFFAKLIRYALWSWAPYLLDTHYGLDKTQAGYYSTIFDVTGFIGTIGAGFVADRLFRSRLAELSFLFMAAMALSCLLLFVMGTTSLTMFAICLGLIGFFLFGPDALLTGAGAVNVGSKKRAALAAGLISGLGSLGPILQELVLPHFMGKEDVGAVFGILLGSSVLSLAALAWMVWRNRTGKAAV